jgi:hypothetical protein
VAQPLDAQPSHVDPAQTGAGARRGGLRRRAGGRPRSQQGPAALGLGRPEGRPDVFPPATCVEGTSILIEAFQSVV